MVVSAGRTRLTAAALLVAVGCGPGADAGEAATAPYLNAQGQLTIAFPRMYSAYDGEHDFRIPAIISQPIGDPPQWWIEPPDAADLEQDASGGIMLTTRKPGDAKVYARAGRFMGVADLHVTSATPEQWMIGEARYRNDVRITVRASAEDGSTPERTGIDLPDDAACGNCHGEGAARLRIQHTPQQIGGFSDDELIEIFTHGVKPRGSNFKSTFSPRIYKEFHTWETASVEESLALVIYLRHLAPRSQEGIDYGLTEAPRRSK